MIIIVETIETTKYLYGRRKNMEQDIKNTLLNCKVGDVFEFGSLPTALIRDEKLISVFNNLDIKTSVFKYNGKMYFKDKEVEFANGKQKYFEFSPAKWLVVDKSKNVLTITTAEISISHHFKYLFEYINSTMINLAFSSEERSLFKLYYDELNGVFYGRLPTVKEIERYGLNNTIPNVTEFGKKMVFTDYKWNVQDTEHNFWCYNGDRLSAMWLKNGTYSPGTCPGLPFFGVRPLFSIDIGKVK